MKARQRYNELETERSQFWTLLGMSRLTCRTLFTETWQGDPSSLHTPWQSVGAKSVVTLAAKLMLALLPPQTTFFKLQEMTSWVRSLTHRSVVNLTCPSPRWRGW